MPKVFSLRLTLRVGLALTVSIIFSACGADDKSGSEVMASRTTQSVNTGLIDDAVRFRAESSRGEQSQTEGSPGGISLPPPDPSVIGSAPCTISGQPLVRQTNGWQVGSRTARTFAAIIVCAGAQTEDPRNGAFFIARTYAPGGNQTFSEVVVPDSGPVAIIKAPLGRSGESVRRADLEFRGARGERGVLHLGPDTAELDMATRVP